jgi:glycosyltransferase involved in cell wall biosynthesis
MRAPIRWSAYGGGDAQILSRLRAQGVRIYGYYRAGSLPALLRRDAVDVALFLSIWPETYALVVDECLLASVPVVAFDIGAPAERLRHSRGILLAPATEPKRIHEAVQAAAGFRVAEPVPDPQPARAHLQLYAEVADRTNPKANGESGPL